MSETFETFTCATCGRGDVTPMAGKGREMLYRNFPSLALPDDLEIPTCSTCGDHWFDHKTLESIDAALKLRAREVRSAISKMSIQLLVESTHQRELEGLLDLSPGYLSKVKHGQETPSASLTALLGLLAARPGRLREIERLWSTRGVALGGAASTSFTSLGAPPLRVPELVEAA